MNRKGLLIALLLAATIALGIRALHKRHGSLLRNRLFASRLLFTHDLYAPWDEDGRPVHAPYPPSYGLVMAPLLLPPLPVARVLWVVLQMTILVLVLRRLGLWWESLVPARAPPAWIFVLPLFLVSRYLLRDTAGGGNNLVFGGLVFLACCRPGEERGEDRRPLLGLGLGLVLAAKPTPLLFLFWLLLRGRLRTAAVALLSAAALHLAPILILGSEGWLEAYSRWGRGVYLYATQADLFARPALGFPPFTWMNQSLRCMLVRFLGEVPPALALDGPLWFQGLGWTPEALLPIRGAATLSVLSFFLLRLSRLRGAFAEAAGPSLCFAVTLLLSPISWKAHHVRLLPAFFTICAWIALAPRTSRHRGLLLGFLTAYALACTLLSEEILRFALGSAAAGKDAKNLLQSLYLVTFGCLALLPLLPGKLPDEPGEPPRARSPEDGGRQGS